jgi:3-dehydroquinate synthase
VTRSLEEALGRIAGIVEGRRVAVVTDDLVESLYGPVVIRGLRALGADVLAYAVPAGERSKSLAQAVALWDWLAESGLGRRDVVLNLGGGVVCDLGGWVASAYMRGVPYVNVPTTLLAQVDGALGGKVAVNHPTAKNLIGAFHQPSAVVCDVGFLASLDGRHLRAALAEVIKKAMIASPEYWDFISGGAGALLERDPDTLEPLVACAAAIKTALVERDPYELDLRRPLNFGHTVGHPLETVTGYGPLLHGEAVAVGMVVETTIAVERGLAAPALRDRLIELLERCELPADVGALPAEIDCDDVIAAMEQVRRIRGGSLRCVLPVELGETLIVDDVGPGEVAAALRYAPSRV